mmetsp:Transcript_79788/g.207428  ORF Transcript_79788/g.207428 Transcript_79788/m.207428 type:complete len:486 (-) Transcript_79788:123-1580(-)
MASEIEEVFCNNGSVRLVGDWWVNGTPTAHTRTSGDYAEFTFQGSGIEVQVYPNADRGSAEIFIDGQSRGVVDGPTSGDDAKTVWFSEIGLPFAMHTIRMVRHGSRQSDGGGELLAFVSFLVHKNKDADTAALAMQRLLSVSKLAASMTRVLFEDVYHGGIQAIYLCKVWKVATFSTKAFTLGSIAAGVMASLAGPIVELSALRSIDQQIGYKRVDLDIDWAVDGENGIAAQKPLQQSLTRSPGFGQSSDEPEQAKGQTLNSEGKAASGQAASASVVMIHTSVRRLLMDPSLAQGAKIRKYLLLAAMVYWVSMGAILLLPGLKCNEPMPKSVWMLFFFSTLLNLLVEIWSLVQCRFGYHLFTSLDSQFFIGVFFGLLGKFDTFSDVTNAAIIRDCAAQHPGLYSWFSIHGHVTRLPFGADLGQLALLGLVLIVFLQAMPALILFATPRLRNYLALSLKFNEFCLLLNALGAEVKLSASAEGPSAP